LALDGSRAEYYREKARHVRALADNAVSPGLKQEYSEIAEQYDRLARQVEEGKLSC
jgi:hypothetical protein